MTSIIISVTRVKIIVRALSCLWVITLYGHQTVQQLFGIVNHLFSPYILRLFSFYIILKKGLYHFDNLYLILSDNKPVTANIHIACNSIKS